MVLKSPLERDRSTTIPRNPTSDIPESNIEDALKYIKENASGGLASVEDDPSPKLGGNLDLNGHQIVGLATVATSGIYDDLTGKPTLGSAASHAAADFATAAQGAKADSALQSFDVAAAVHAATGKTTPVDADELALVDSAASNGLKKLTWANLKATLKTYFDTLYQPIATALTSWAGVTRASGFDTFAATPSSANLRALLTDETGTGVAYFVGGALGTPASGTLTNCSGLPVTGISASTSQPIGVGSIELGHASDTTLSRASAGRLAIEGVNVVTVSSTDTLTNKTLTSPTLTAPVLGTPASGDLSNCSAFAGDSGSGGTKGVVPAPASGDAAAAKFLKADGSWATPAGGASTNGPTLQTFTSSGTWTKPTGVKRIRATIIGAGGGGGGVKLAAATTYAGGAGGGSGASVVTYLDVTSISSLTVTVGSGGAGGTTSGTNGSTGGNSGLGTSNANGLANGGVGGEGCTSRPSSSSIPVSFSIGGAGGSASSGSINIPGNPGQSGMGDQPHTASVGGGGAPSLLGGGAATSSGNSGGNNGTYGGGGGGASVTASSTGQAGGTGGGGIVFIEEYYA